MEIISFEAGFFVPSRPPVATESLSMTICRTHSPDTTYCPSGECHLNWFIAITNDIISIPLDQPFPCLRGSRGSSIEWILLFYFRFWKLTSSRKIFMRNDGPIPIRIRRERRVLGYGRTISLARKQITFYFVMRLNSVDSTRTFISFAFNHRANRWCFDEGSSPWKSGIKRNNSNLRSQTNRNRHHRFAPLKSKVSLLSFKNALRCTDASNVRSLVFTSLAFQNSSPASITRHWHAIEIVTPTRWAAARWSAQRTTRLNAVSGDLMHQDSRIKCRNDGLSRFNAFRIELGARARLMHSSHVPCIHTEQQM